jgi:hypothetical protein
MTVAAITAVALGRAVAEYRQRRGGDLPGFARPFQQQVARHGAHAWQLSTGEDLRYATTQRPRPGRLGRLQYRYADRVLAIANGSQRVQSSFLRVLHRLDPQAALTHPGVLLPVLAGRRVAPLDGPPMAPWPTAPADRTPPTP